MINIERVKQTFLDMVMINSPSKQERAMADYVITKLKGLGFDVREDDAASKIGGNAGNIVAFKNGSVPGAKCILLSAHIDTVEPTPNIKLVFDNDEIRTNGSSILGADDKAGIAAILEGLQSITEEKTPHGDIQVIFDVAEEIGLLGARQLDMADIKAEFGFVFDTQKPVAGITWSAPSHVNILVEIQGTASHAGIAPENGISAIIAASNAISKMNLGRIDSETTANIGVIEGGKARNIVPERVTVKAEARSRDEAKLNAQVEHMKTVFEEEAAKIGAVATVTVECEYSAFRFSESDEIVKLAVEASRRAGIEPTFQDGGGGSDANVFNNIGLPSLVIGVGYDGAHSKSELVAVSDLARCAQYAAALIDTAARSEA